LPSEYYIQTYTNAGILPSDSTVAIPGRQKDVLFAPIEGPEEETDVSGDDVGSAPVSDVLWWMILGCLAYGIYCRKKMSDP
jgi:hypothetical protein